MTISAVFGIDVGTSSTKAVLVDPDGKIIRSATREHEVSRPMPGQVEMDACLWWEEFLDLATELMAPKDVQIESIGVSGMGPCVLLTDSAGDPVRPAILYGVDTRSGEQIKRLNTELGEQAILERCSSVLTSQAAGPKILWVSENEPATYATASRFFMPASYLGFKLTGEYVLDHHSASQSTPLYDTENLAWIGPWAERVAPGIELPQLKWPGEIAGKVTDIAARDLAGIQPGTPVITGTIDAWSEALSVGAQTPGDLMLMYGTTMFLIATTSERTQSAILWGTVGAIQGTYNLAGGMATSGAVTSWIRNLTGSDSYEALTTEARDSGMGARGLLMLPYFAGERTPIHDPDARGVIVGLTLEHTRGDLYRAALEATAFGVKHNVEALKQSGIDIQRVVAVGGGAQGGLWTRIVSDVTGLNQVIPEITVGASYGAARLAAEHAPSFQSGTHHWNPPADILAPHKDRHQFYEGLYESYRVLYPATKEVSHRLAAFQQGKTVDEKRIHQPSEVRNRS